jgi:hypothetical protein
MFATMMALALASSGAEDRLQLRLAAPGLRGVNLDTPTLEFLNEHLAGRLALAGASVLSPREVSAVLELERNRQMLGCAESEAACLTEIAQALGADAVLVGDLARLETRLQATLRLVSATDASALARWTGSATTVEGLVVAFDEAAPQLAGDAARKLDRRLAPTAAQGQPSTGREAWRWAPGVMGVAAAGAGGFALWRAGGNYRELTTRAPLDEPSARALRDDGKQWQTLGWVGLAAGAAGIGASAYLLRPPSPVSRSHAAVTAVIPGAHAGGIGLTVQGVMP